MAYADVVVENFKPGTFDAIVGEVPEDTIVCSISGYGQHGPRRDEVAFDLTMQARSGIMSITGDADGPAKVGVAWIDVMTGMNAVSSILAALYHREKTGKGARIDISLWDTALASLVNQGITLAGITPGRMGKHLISCPTRRLKRAMDGSPSVWAPRTSGTSLLRRWRWPCPNTGRTTAPELKSERRLKQPFKQPFIAGPSHPRGVAEGHSVRAGQHGERSVGRHPNRGSEDSVEHEGVMTLASPLRFIQPSNENSEV